MELRPSCEHCNVALPPDSLNARICSFECTFCKTCVENVLRNVCPNCGGGFTERPVPPTSNWVGKTSLATYPASATIKHKPVNAAAHAELVGRVGKLAPHKR